MTTNTKTITAKSYRHNRETDIAESSTTRIKITIVPAAGEKFGMQGMEHAAKLAAIAAFELATEFLCAIPPGCTYCLPSVAGGDTWAGGASAFVTFEHDGVEVAITAIEKVVEQARK